MKQEHVETWLNALKVFKDSNYVKGRKVEKMYLINLSGQGDTEIKLTTEAIGEWIDSLSQKAAKNTLKGRF